MNFNKVILAGNLTRDPQLSYTPSQTAVCAFGMAINRKWKDKEDVCFVDCEAWSKTAETINKHFSKGRPIFVEGFLKFENWTAQDGTKRNRLKVVVQNFQFVAPPEKQENQGRQQEPEPTPDDEIPF